MLLDTSGCACFFEADNSSHEKAVNFFKAAPVLITHSYVLSEFVTLIHARGMRRADATAFVRALYNASRVEVVWVDESLHGEAMDLLDARPDKNYSMCDAVSFVLMRKRGLFDALTTDHHFAQEGFRQLL